MSTIVFWGLMIGVGLMNDFTRSETDLLLAMSEADLLSARSSVVGFLLMKLWLFGVKFNFASKSFFLSLLNYNFSIFYEILYSSEYWLDLSDFELESTFSIRALNLDFSLIISGIYMGFIVILLFISKQLGKVIFSDPTVFISGDATLMMFESDVFYLAGSLLIYLNSLATIIVLTECETIF